MKDGVLTDVNGVADNVLDLNGKLTAIEAKYRHEVEVSDEFSRQKNTRNHRV